MNQISDPKITSLYGGDRPWFDVHEKKFVPLTTLYLPYGDARGGCPDWRGKWKGGDITKMPCVFCALPNAVKGYQDAFYAGAPVPHEDIVDAFVHNLRAATSKRVPLHTLAVFNGGSFLAMGSELQRNIIAHASASGVRRLVIESRAELVTDDVITAIRHQLTQYGVELTVRIGVETQDDKVRMLVLRKGHARKALMNAVSILHANNVTVGGYAIVKPAPLSWIQNVHPHVLNYDEWALQEGVATIDAILNEFGMDEVYLCSTCVAPGTLLEKLWEEDEYEPASLSLIAAVLATALKKETKPVHLLPFSDEPAFVAVSSNHSPKGVHQDEIHLHEHDVWFRDLLDTYRSTMDVETLDRRHIALRHNTHDCSLCSKSVKE